MREIRRLAHLHMPAEWEPGEIVPEARKLGFTDLYFSVNKVESGVDIGGLRLSTAMEVGRLAEREGMGVLVNTGYMKYHEQVVLAHPERRMVLRDDGTGNRSRVTASVQASGDRTAAEGRVRNVNWLCPFNEANKSRYKDELRRLARIPALRFVYLNDEGFLGAYGEMACYCDSCRVRFADRFGREPPTGIDWKDPLWRNWIRWRFKRWTAVHAEFRRILRDEGLPYAFVWDSRLDETDLDRNDPLVLPHVCCLSRQQRVQLTAYLEDGGRILAISDLGLFDEEGRPAGDGLGFRWGVGVNGKRLAGQYRLSFTDECPVQTEVTAPAVVENPYEIGRVEGEVWATLVDADGRDTGAPGLVSSLVGEGRFVYLAGDPVLHHREPGYEPLVMLPNHTRRLIGNLIRFLARRPASIEVEDFPPKTAYQRLRPWDRRGINTFQFFPQAGPRYAIAILASYLGAEATVSIRFRIPPGKRLSRIFNGLTEASCMTDASIESQSIQYRLSITQADGVIPVVAEWE